MTDKWLKAVLASASDACLDASELEEPRALLARLIEHHVMLALDPRISAQAPERQAMPMATPTTSIGTLAKTLIEHATAVGLVVTIERRPPKPLSMGNAEYVIETRPARQGSEK